MKRVLGSIKPTRLPFSFRFLKWLLLLKKEQAEHERYTDKQKQDKKKSQKETRKGPEPGDIGEVVFANTTSTISPLFKSFHNIRS